MIRIRGATVADVPALLPMLKSFAEFADTRHSLYPGDDAAALKVVELISEHVFFVAENVIIEEWDTDRTLGITGFIAGMLMPHWFNPDISLLTELLWWVEPEHRGSRAGAALLKAFMDHGEEHAHQMTMTLEAASPVKADTLEARGFHLHERTFLREMHV